MLRDSLRRSFDGVAERGPRAKRLLRTLHDLSVANDAFSQAFSQFSRETCDFLGGDGSPAAMGAAFAQHIQLLSSVEESRRLMLAVHIAELEKTLEACANSSGALRDSFRGFQHACDRVDAAAARMAGAKPAKRAEETVRAEEAQRLHAAVAAKLQQGLLDASTGSALDIAERVYQLVHAHKTWMHASHESFLTLQGGREHHDQLELALLDERKAYEKQREAAARLETELQAVAISSSSSSVSSSPPLPQQSQQSQQQGEFFSGHLFERVRANAFKRRYCAIDIEKGQLQVFDASGAAAVPSRTIDLLLTSARVRADVGERVNLFEVLAPNRTLMFQAESAEGVARWMAALERARGEVLSRQTGQEASTEHTQTRDNAALLAALWNASPANRRCAECGASSACFFFFFFPTTIPLHSPFHLFLLFSSSHLSLFPLRKTTPPLAIMHVSRATTRFRA